MSKNDPAKPNATSGVDPMLTLSLAQASLAAYADYDRKPIVPPPNYRCVERWTGWDGSIFGGVEERFGLLFESIHPEQAKTYIFAFRGTDSDMDMYEDIFAETTVFKPTNGTVVPTPHVAAGFYDVYNARGGTMKHSMREQVFALIEKYKPARIYITGHSLGAALSELFSLDVAVSKPEIWAANMNFSCPRVGLESWKAAYEVQPAEHDPERQTVRVYNYYDYIPSLPPSFLTGYAHVGRSFRTAFFVKDEWYPHVVARHSIVNLQTVLQHAVWLKPQVWVGVFHNAEDPTQCMRSVVPPSGADQQWADHSIEIVTQERALSD